MDIFQSSRYQLKKNIYLLSAQLGKTICHSVPCLGKHYMVVQIQECLFSQNTEGLLMGLFKAIPSGIHRRHYSEQNALGNCNP